MKFTLTFEEYLNNIPLLHTWDNGKTWNTGGFEQMHLKAFYELIEEGWHILETGLGNSTITFLYTNPSKLTTIAIDPGLFKRIIDFCEKNNIDYSKLQQHIGRSEWLLPEIALKIYNSCERIDMALIDGGHGWPTVFVDFCYTNAILKKGGYLIVDDIQLHSIKELARLIHNETTRYSLYQNLGKTMIFKKLTDEPFLPDWNDLKYIVDQTNKYTNPFSL